MQASRLCRLIINSQSLTRGFRNQAIIMAPIKVGDAVPSVNLYEGNPGNSVNTTDAFGKGKHVVFAIPGAFTPTCQNEHFPTFVSEFNKIKAKGVDSVNCVSVNDPFVMAAFSNAINGNNGKVRCLADTTGEFTKAVDLGWDLTGPLGNVRSQRYVMVIQDGKVTGINVEQDSSKAACTKGTDVMSLL